MLLTGAVRDLVQTYPGEFEIHIASGCPELWQNNPHIAGAWGAFGPRNIPLLPIRYQRYMGSADFSSLHFLTAFHRALGDLLNVEIPVLEPSGDLRLSVEERSSPIVEGRYWLFIAGGKRDMLTKIWPTRYAQRLVDLLNCEGIRIVQAGAIASGHTHPKLSGVLNLVGKTNLRQMLQLIFHADGVICPVTFAMHAAAALRRPCVVIAGGREPFWWEGYLNPVSYSFGPKCAPVAVPHRFLHSLGQLPCCEQGGCWKSNLNPHRPAGTRDCLMPIYVTQGTVAAACLAKIYPEYVVDAVLSYYRDGTLKAVSTVGTPNGIPR